MMHGQFKFQPARRSYSSSASSSLQGKKQPSSTAPDTVVAKIKRRSSGGRQRPEDEDDARLLSSAYFTLLLLASLVVVVLAGDNFFIDLYSNMLDDATPPAVLPPSFLPLSYSDCFLDEGLLSLHILAPVDEELTANSRVSMTVTGRFFRAAPPPSSSVSRHRDAVVRVRLDDNQDIHFPGGNNMTIPLYETKFDLAFDLAHVGLGFGSKQGPYKLTAEIFIPLQPSDVHYAECASANKHTLMASHSVHFFYIPIREEEPETAALSETLVKNTQTKVPGDDRNEPPAREQTLSRAGRSTTANGDDSGGSDVDADATGAVAKKGAGASSSNAESLTVPVSSDNNIVISGKDAIPGFLFTKMLSLSYRGGCTGADSEGNIRLGVSLHPQILARGHLGSQECVDQFLSSSEADTATAAANCTPATFVLSYLGSNYDISTHIRSESESFMTSPTLQLLKGGNSSPVQRQQMLPISDIVIVLEEVARLPQSTSHLLQLYVCNTASGSSSASNREGHTLTATEQEREQERLHACTVAPLAWDALLVQCDAGAASSP